MTTDDRTELTNEERAAFDALPKEREPGRLLEERTVQALRDRRLIGASRLRRPYGRAPMLAAGLAASVALFVSGVAVGQWLGSRTVTDTVIAVQQQSAMQTAAAVQRAGSAYVTALTTLARIADTSNAPAVSQGREAALTALYAATHELVLLAPEDPLAVTLRDGLARARQAGATAEAEETQRLVWF